MKYIIGFLFKIFKRSLNSCEKAMKYSEKKVGLNSIKLEMSPSLETGVEKEDFECLLTIHKNFSICNGCFFPTSSKVDILNDFPKMDKLLEVILNHSMLNENTEILFFRSFFKESTPQK